jgi:hypothetical protein
MTVLHCRSRLIFSSNFAADKRLEYDIYLMDIGSGKTMVADLSWRPDGRAFGAHVGGRVVTPSSQERIVLVEIQLER